ncbi:MAG: D-alanyl-D-alanine carboxypeptidase, partial [Pseudomonas marincola]|uniref:D-alanyl-D-alanine carboxypeptidase n=3 Tax=Pseudomonas TaxID=286 RepID=UPI003003752A
MLKALRHLAIASFLIPLTLPLTVSAASYLPSNVEKSLKASKVSPQSLSVAVVPLSRAGDSNFYNADVSVNPASTMKIITTYAALELLGPTYQWRTDFYADGPVRGGVLNGNLYFKGGGDPKLNMEKLWLLLRDLRANGVTKVTGDLVLDRSYFKQPQLPAFNDDGGDKNKPYLVTPDSL